jgi:UDP-glucose 4-epimerase
MASVGTDGRAGAMKILFTGASSFTGYWFVNALAAASHDVFCTFTRGSAEEYAGDVRGQRVNQVAKVSQPIFSCCFGDQRFREILQREKFDLICHHAADVTDYKSPNFDVSRAVCRNTQGACEVLEGLTKNSGAALLLTGSVFEGGEGAGSDGLPSFSPYGLSKRLTSEIFEYYALSLGLPLGKFVIPNPFGPWEDARFTAYLMRTWAARQAAAVRTPAYIRDNIHVSLLSKAYVRFAESLSAAVGFCRYNPSGYVESQGEFSERVAREVRARTGWMCDLEHATQIVFDEPRVRTNTDPIDGQKLAWNEAAAWDAFSHWYVS